MFKQYLISILALLSFLAGCATPPAAQAGPGATLPATPLAISAGMLTGTSVVIRKETGQAQMALTLTAIPTSTATATVPPGAALCRAANLAGEAYAEGATGAMTFGLTITNTGSQTCVLLGPPQVQLVDRAGHQLEVDTLLNCFACAAQGELTPTPSMETQAAPTTQAALAPAQTAQAQTVLTGKLGLAPGESANVFLIWRNWCQPFPAVGVTLRLVLPAGQGQLNTPSEARTGGRCDAPGAHSTLVVSEYHYS